MTKRIWTILLLTWLALSGAALAEGGKPGVVVQVSDDSVATWNQALNVVKNIQAEYGKDKVDIELVVFGNGVGLLKFDSQLANRVDETLASGAKVLMCQNTMRARKLTAEDMHAGIGFVKAGVVEIIEKQRQGWAVIRP
ncbi:MAG: DsrE family protein [Rhodocyclaceae bacterium]